MGWDTMGQCKISWCHLEWCTILKLRTYWIVYFWNFPFNIFGLQLTLVTKTKETKTVDKGGLLYTYLGNRKSVHIYSLDFSYNSKTYAKSVVLPNRLKTIHKTLLNINKPNNLWHLCLEKQTKNNTIFPRMVSHWDNEKICTV